MVAPAGTVFRGAMPLSNTFPGGGQHRPNCWIADFTDKDLRACLEKPLNCSSRRDEADGPL